MADGRDGYPGGMAALPLTLLERCDARTRQGLTATEARNKALLPFFFDLQDHTFPEDV